MGKNLKAPRIVILGFLTVLTVLFWIAFSVYQAFFTSPDLNIPPEIIAPLDPTLDSEALTILDKSIYLNDEEIGNTQYGQVSVEEESDQTEEVNQTTVVEEEATVSAQTNEES